MNLGNKLDLKEIENQVRSYYNDPKIKIKIKDFIDNQNNFSTTVGYVEGPPTMNGEPHLGHIRGRIIKDLWYRKSIFQGKKMIFRAGWDSQGLPVELQAEKILGLGGNKSENLRKVGIEKIVETCKKIISEYNKKWLEVDHQVGMSFDYENAYWTFKDSYIEREWTYIKKAFEEGILQEWFRVVAYCPSCQTSLSNIEINQSYEQVEDPSFYYKVKLEKSDTYLVVWTTMPFTLVTDELVAINPKAKYLTVDVSLATSTEKWIISEDRLESLMNELKIKEYNVINTFIGKELEGQTYIHPLLSNIPGLSKLASSNKIHYVVAEDFVDFTTGSGIVHISPANGEEDFEIATRRGLPIFVPLDDRAYFTQEAGKYQNRFVRDVEMEVVDDMRLTNSVIKIGRLVHKYPTCWRSHHKIIWFARKEYFYMIDKLGDRPFEAASSVEYFYDQPKNRFLEIIKERVPWCISRERVWGTPLPIWKCKNCSATEGLFSRNEIVKRASNLPQGPNFELHRPWIDEIKIQCLNCYGDMNREPFVLDTWHNSGSAPYSSLSTQEFEHYMPATFLTEGIDQTRGWAYTLLMLNVILQDTSESPFKSFLFTGHVLDEKGNKMSKSLGNVVDAYSLLKNNPVDLVRFYFMWKSSPIEPLNFDIREMISRPHQILSTLYYLHVYYQQNALYDMFDYAGLKERSLIDMDRKTLKSQDIWILTKLEKLITRFNNLVDNCRFHEASHEVEDFIINSLSQTYVPLIRYDLWSDDQEHKDRRFTVYTILSTCLFALDLILHPICPFVTEHLYQSCFKRNDIIMMDRSLNLSSLKKISDDKVEVAFDKIKEISSMSFSLRNKLKLKRRWPLESLYIFSDDVEFLKMEGVLELLQDQTNIERIVINKVRWTNNATKIIDMVKNQAPIHPSITINRKTVAKEVRGDIGLVIDKFEEQDKLFVLEQLQESGSFNLEYSSEKFVRITLQDVNIDFEATSGYSALERDHLILLLNTHRNDDLTIKGLVKDLARNIQQLRKELGYSPTKILNTAYISNFSKDEVTKIQKFDTDLRNLVRVKKIEFSIGISQGEYKSKQIEIDGKEITIYIH
ncbi:MAG TPA: isoleucine--tRNA ligase [Candidatus Saccharimonadales bacterium]|nr:isoleucine--tRNA ligase [Candidatus Saccharimonadales bacterium]